LWAWFSTNYDKKLQYRIEWETDMMAIKKGHGKYLLYSQKSMTSAQKKGYMSIEEIKKLMKEFK